MRIAYIVRWDVGSESGVLKKIREQIVTWHKYGHEVKLFALTVSPRLWSGLEGIDVVTFVARGLAAREVQARRLAQEVASWRPDLAYLRFSTHFFGLEPLFRRTPVVLELNTDDLEEYKEYLSWPKYVLHRATRRRTLGRACGMVAVTRELASKYNGFRKPIKIIANGIDLEAYPVLPPTMHGRVHAVFVGSPGISWHGVDEILTLAEHLADWHFDLIGPELTSAPGNVVAHGTLGRTEYERILTSADVAIGTLALHRKGMSEACPLKVREYLAFGIPCIIGFDDTDFVQPVDFILKVPNAPGSVVANRDRIRAFGESWRGRRVGREDIRHLDVRAKERDRLEFLRSILAQWREYSPRPAGGRKP